MAVVDDSASQSERAKGYIAALGGAANLKSVDACTTRLRLQLANDDIVSEAALKALGSRGMIRPAKGSLQVVIGPEADLLADEIHQVLHAIAATPASVVGFDRSAWVTALGGESNIFAVEVVAGTRLRIELADAVRVDASTLKALGAQEVVPFSSTLLHVVLGTEAEATQAANSLKSA
jgi:PTS system N-acetylglucosamine-specific IIC component